MLGACGQDGDKSNKADNKQSEHKNRMTLKRIKMRKQIIRKIQRITLVKINSMLIQIVTIHLAINLKVHLKIIMVNHKITISIMNEHKANKFKLHNKITNNKVTIIKLNNKITYNKAITNNHKIITVI